MVDEGYPEADPTTGKPKYNLHNLKLADAASIDDGYFQTAICLSNNCVDRLVRWSDECTAMGRFRPGPQCRPFVWNLKRSDRSDYLGQMALDTYFLYFSLCDSLELRSSRG